MARILITTLVILGLFGSTAHSASVMGHIRFEVLEQIIIRAVKNLRFQSVYAGAAATTIDPLSEEAAHFQISGQASSSFSIKLPTEIKLVSQDGTESLTINDFKSYPEAEGTIGTDGQSLLKVGATRLEIPKSQKSGTYTGVYKVEVIY